MTDVPSSPRSDIADLFATDPLKLTKTDRSQIIAYYRANRERFIVGQKQEKLPKAKAEKATPGPKLKLDLGDLGL